MIETQTIINLTAAFVIISLVIQVDDLKRRIDKLEDKNKQDESR